MYVLFNASNILLIKHAPLYLVPATSLFSLKPATTTAATPAGELSACSVDDPSDIYCTASTPPANLFGAKIGSATTAPAGEITFYR